MDGNASFGWRLMVDRAPRLYAIQGADLEQLESAGAGGKALGLARLCAFGFAVPEAFVLTGASDAADADLSSLSQSFLSQPLAVRSSALAEDGAERSFAGQYESVLNVSGEAELRAALHTCLRSAQSLRALAYQGGQGQGADDGMAIVIQAMIAPSSAGVVFTADPMTGRRDRMVIDAVHGLGEALVSGQAEPHHVVLDTRGRVVTSECPEAGEVLDPSKLEAIYAGARAIEEAFDEPLDMEWAIDEEGDLWWLQARPITTLPLPLDLMDTEAVESGDVYTRANIGEMMPGAVTPLTLSVTVRGIDYGIQAMQVAVGVREAIEDRAVFTATFCGHIFLNLSAFGAMVLGVAGSNSERLCRALCGRPLDELKLGKPWSWWRRAINGIRYGRYLFSAPKHRRALAHDLHHWEMPHFDDAEQLYQWIDKRLPVLFRAYDHHMTSSAVSGALVPALLEILSQGRPPTHAHEAQCAALLISGGGGEVESLDLAAGVAELAAAVAADPEALGCVESEEPLDIAAWMEACEGEAGQLWRAYVGKHGHRSLRELELRQPEWGHDPTPLIMSLRVALRAAGKRVSPGVFSPPQASSVARWVARRARAAAAKREESKSMLVAMTVHFKRAYRRLGELLVEAGALADIDQVFFFTHKELPSVLRGELEAAARADARRNVLAYQGRLSFPEVFVGRGLPEDPQPVALAPEGGFVGKAVSRGRAEGPARVVTRLEQLDEVQPGEVLIARVVDVGWTPCFSIIAGLATEVGSAVSHGCVVAREFGLPALVGLRGITQSVKSGQWVVLDAERGILQVADRDDDTH